MADPELAEPGTEAAGGEGAAVIRTEHELARLDPVPRRRVVDDRDCFVGAAAQLELPADDLAGAAVDDRHSDTSSRARPPTRSSDPAATTAVAVRPGRSRAASCAPVAAAVGSASARASPAAPACG